MIFWLKYLGKYSVAEINIIPIGQSVVGIILSKPDLLIPLRCLTRYLPR